MRPRPDRGAAEGADISGRDAAVNPGSSTWR